MILSVYINIIVKICQKMFFLYILLIYILKRTNILLTKKN